MGFWKILKDVVIGSEKDLNLGNRKTALDKNIEQSNQDYQKKVEEADRRNQKIENSNRLRDLKKDEFIYDSF